MRRLLKRNRVPEDGSKYYFEFDRNAPSMLDAKQTMDVIAFCNRDTKYATFVSIFTFSLSLSLPPTFLSFLWTLPLAWIINAYKLHDACRVSCQAVSCRITLSRLILVNKRFNRLILWIWRFPRQIVKVDQLILLTWSKVGHIPIAQNIYNKPIIKIKKFIYTQYVGREVKLIKCFNKGK